MDVFVAYSSSDEARVRTIVEWLRRNDLVVWVAYELPAGLDWDTEIDRVLAEIPCVLTVWSPDAVASPEVKGEARAAMARDALVTVSLDNALPPRSFTHLHAVDLTGLSVDECSPRTAQALCGIRAKLGESVAGSTEAPQAADTRRPAPGIGPRHLWVGMVAVALLAVGSLVAIDSIGLAQASCDDAEAFVLAGQKFDKDMRIEKPVVCIAANAELRIRNGARLDVEAETLIIEGAAHFDGRGEPGARGRAGSNGAVHHHKPPKVGVIAVCGNAPSKSDYSGSNGGRGGNGGKGASISIRYRELHGDPALLNHEVAGGAGGVGGAGGRAGRAICKALKPYDVRGKNGRKGRPGTQGKSGSFELVRIDA